jgi:hypothetical protein
MGGSDGDAPQGPDLASGVPVDQIADGSMLAGHVGGEAVPLARQAGRAA